MKTFVSGLFSLLLLASCGNSNKEDSAQASKKPTNLMEQKEVRIQQIDQTPEYLYRIISIEEWRESQIQNQVVNSPLDKEFIHLAMEEQLPHIAQKFWNNQDHMILKLVSKKLEGRLIFETNPGGATLYYHLYEGNIPLDAVVEVSTVHAAHLNE